MNRKLVLAAALVFGLAGLILAQVTVKAQDAVDNSVMVAANSDAGMAMNAADAGMAMNADAGAAMNAAAPAAAQ